MPSLSGKTIGTNENSFVEIQFDCGASLGTLDLWGVQLEQNTTQTAFEREPFQVSLHKCLRYYETSYPLGTPVGTVGLIGNGLIIASSALAGSTAGNLGGANILPFKVEKRTTPTLKFYDYDGTADALRVYPADGKRSGITAYNGPNATGYVQYLSFNNASAQAIALGAQLQFHWVASAEL
jgi:hypothetical protein